MKILQLLRDNAARLAHPLNLVRNAGGEASLYIYGIIAADWGVNSLDVIAALAQAGDAKVLNVYINSPGGDVFEGRAIMSALARFEGQKIAHIDSVCASAATSVALACNEVRISDGAFFMIHNAKAMAFGDKSQIRAVADTVEKIEGAIVDDYVNKTGQDVAQITQWMDAETWFSAAEAHAAGFVDAITPAATGKATNAATPWNLAAFNNAPKELQNALPPTSSPAPAPAPAPVSMSTTNSNRLRLAELV